MYNYQPTINQEFILERYSQFDIFKALLGVEIGIGKSYLYFAPYRIDKQPGCFFSYFNGILYFIDFANTITHFNCFQLWSYIYDIEITLVPEAIYHSIKAKNIKISQKNTKEKKILTKKLKEHKPTIITVLDKPFNLEDKIYWQQYGITSKQLKEDKVLSVLAFKIESTKIFCQRPFKICYAYTDFDNNKKKIYQPYANKTNKWFTNCGKNDIGQIKNLLNNIPDQAVIITKSYKDCRILRNYGFASIWFQNEGMFPDDQNLSLLLQNIPKSIIFFDNDLQGITSSAALTKKIQELGFNTESICLPEALLKNNITDISDLYAAKGPTEVQNFLNNTIK